MAIKIYRTCTYGPAPVNNKGVAGWCKALSPGNRMRLIRVSIAFQSFDPANDKIDNPYTTNDNYIVCNLDNTGLSNPFLNMNHNIAVGTPDFTPGQSFYFPGTYELDIQYEDQIWFLFNSYNHSAVPKHHVFEVVLTVDETPL